MRRGGREGESREEVLGEKKLSRNPPSHERKEGGPRSASRGGNIHPSVLKKKKGSGFPQKKKKKKKKKKKNSQTLRNTRKRVGF